MNNLKRWERSEVSVWPSFGRLFGLRDELDRLFEGSLGEFGSGSRLLSSWNPAVDVYESDDKVIVKAELPGMKKEEIEVSLHNGALTISGERKSEEKFESAEACRVERFVGRFQRSIALPSDVNGGTVQAQYKDGILTVTLPKAEEARRKHIEIKVS